MGRVSYGRPFVWSSHGVLQMNQLPSLYFRSEKRNKSRTNDWDRFEISGSRILSGIQQVYGENKGVGGSLRRREDLRIHETLTFKLLRGFGSRELQDIFRELILRVWKICGNKNFLDYYVQKLSDAWKRYGNCGKFAKYSFRWVKIGIISIQQRYDLKFADIERMINNFSK